MYVTAQRMNSKIIACSVKNLSEAISKHDWVRVFTRCFSLLTFWFSQLISSIATTVPFSLSREDQQIINQHDEKQPFNSIQDTIKDHCWWFISKEEEVSPSWRCGRTVLLQPSACFKSRFKISSECIGDTLSSDLFEFVYSRTFFYSHHRSSCSPPRSST